MGRLKAEQAEEGRKLTLEELVPLYGEKNTECNALKKEVADLNATLKTAIKDAKQQNKDIKIDGWKCTLTVAEDVKVNEDRLLLVLKTYGVPAVRTREYIDFDELERLIYAGSISQDVLLEMDACNDKTLKETLRCTKQKGG